MRLLTEDDQLNDPNSVFARLPRELQDAYIDAIAALDDEAPGGDIEAFNEAPETTQADVLAAFDRAIAKLERARRAGV